MAETSQDAIDEIVVKVEGPEEKTSLNGDPGVRSSNESCKLSPRQLTDSFEDEVFVQPKTTREKSPVFYLDPVDWARTESPIPTRCTSPLSRPALKTIPSVTINKPYHGHGKPHNRLLYSPPGLRIGRLQQSESLETLPEHSRLRNGTIQQPPDIFTFNNHPNRIRSLSTSGHSKSTTKPHLHRQSFGSGSSLITSPIKRGTTVEDRPYFPLEKHGVTRKLSAPLVGDNSRLRKTAIPIICARAAAMVKKLCYILVDWSHSGSKVLQ